MFLHIREVVVRGDPRRTLELAARARELVQAKSGLRLSLWAAVTGAPVGTLYYTSFVQSRAEDDAASTTLLADDEYLELLAEADQYLAAPPQDSLLEILHASGGEYRSAPVGSVATMYRAQIANARYGKASQWGVEMSELASEITGNPGLFVRGTEGGPFGAVGWLSTVADMAAADAANEALAKDSRYLAKLDEMGDLFVPGSGAGTVSKRIA